MIPSWLTFFAGVACLALALNFFRQSVEPQVWVAFEGDQVSVVARSPDGKIFRIMRLDRKFLDANDDVIGLQMNKAPAAAPAGKDPEI